MQYRNPYGQAIIIPVYCSSREKKRDGTGDIGMG